tara:strand:- start:5059 stop:6045 length:987 start_codon:yes stop_codon:yes gene_type:complete
MGLFNTQENRIKCGRCGTEFDLYKNKDYCPLCGFGKNTYKEVASLKLSKEKAKAGDLNEFLSIPPTLNLKEGEVYVDAETKVWGSWLMFNDFFAPKFLTRILAWKIKKENSNYINLYSLIEKSIELIEKQGLSELKGFPSKVKEPDNLQKDSAVGRLVYHFLHTAFNMGLFEVRALDSKIENVWGQDWKKIEITLTKEGLEFAQIKNSIFDNGKKEQTLSSEEKKWLIDYLEKIDKQGYKEYSVLKEVYHFLKEDHNGKQDLWEWFENNKRFLNYISQRSKRARNNPKLFKQQVYNYARTFAAAKISLLRELGVVNNKRNDYTIVGEL